MKIIYSHLKTFLPDINVTPQKLRDDITMIGHFTNFYEEIDNEIVFDLDIKINRGDCLGYYGLAKDLSILYNIPLVPAKEFQHPPSNYSLPITIETDNVIRLMAAKIVHIQNKHSPDWLSKFLKLHGVNSINTLVDLTNYIMFMYGLPSHAFDTAKSTDKLIWQMNPQYTSFKSLDGTVLPIDKNILMVNNSQFALSLSFWGGEFCAIDNRTTNTIVEIAVYNSTVVRQNRQQLKVTTEAATRLEKLLDPNSIPMALNHLIRLITLNCGGSLGSKIFDYYPNPIENKSIEFDPELPSIISGIKIPVDFANDIVAKVGSRPDITQAEDLAEEVIRFYGYNNIPKDQPISYKKISDITPKILYLIEQLKDQLVGEGYDEVITWPLVSAPVNQKTVIKTENSINAEVIYLRQSLVPSLKLQLEQYQKYKLPNPKFFEIGKIFYKDGDKFIEKYALGKYDGQNFSEIILDDQDLPDNYIPKVIDNNAVELTGQIITLDANVTITEKIDPLKLIKQYSSKIDKSILWSMEITDIFENKYTFRVNYYNTDDKTAKKIHLSTFNLSSEKYNYVDPKKPTILEYYSDMYQAELEATIIDIKSNNIILDKTIFFPEGGGQPSDMGTINNIPVTKLQYKDEQVLHQVDQSVFAIGDTVKLKIDWDSRLKYMKIHSAGHLLHEVLTEIYPTIIPQKGYHHDGAYLIYRGQINNSDIDQIETIFNKKVDENLPVLCDYTDIETLKKDAKSIPKNLPMHKKLRRLKIGNYPSMADGGIQVKSTKEIGNITISKIDNNDNLSTVFYKLK